MKKYTHIFFDLDRTLWDYDSNASDTLNDLIDRYKVLENLPIEKETFVNEFFIINEDLWSKFDQGIIDKSFIRTHRFRLLFEKLKLTDFKYLNELQEDFLAECPTKGKLINGADRTVKQLSEVYSLYIITNGFNEIQHLKLKNSGLEHYFIEIITSEKAKVQKPNPTIFDFAISIAKAEKSSSIMVGDNYDSDIMGAKSAGIDQIFFNSSSGKANFDHLERSNGFKPTFEISRIDQLADILL